VGDVGAALCPPYDVISSSEQQRLLEQSPYNIVRVELSREEPGDNETNNRYTRAAETLRGWRESGALREEPRHAYYLMAHSFAWAGQSFTRHGLFAAVRLREWADGVVLPHEETFSGPKEDRFKLLSATSVNVSPVFMVLREQSNALKNAWSTVRASHPDVDVTIAGERQQLWVVDDPAQVSDIAEQLEGRTLYIADGHHRYETALRYAQERTAAERLPAEHPAQFVLTYVATMDDPGLAVFPTHRLVRGVSAERVRQLISDYDSAFSIESVKLDNGADGLENVQRRLDEMGSVRPTFGVLGTGEDNVALVTLTDPGAMERLASSATPAWRALDVSVLQTMILDALLPTHQERDASVTYFRDSAAALDEVRSGRAQVAFLMSTPSVAAMANVADSRARMPEKSTYFYPKVPTGMVMRSIA
jgi:uncharacterized protein (DUF1015 family)